MGFLSPFDPVKHPGSVWLGFKKFRVGMPWCLVLRCPCLVLSTTLLAVFGLIGLGVTSAPIVLNTDFETRLLNGILWDCQGICRGFPMAFHGMFKGFSWDLGRIFMGFSGDLIGFDGMFMGLNGISVGLL